MSENSTERETPIREYVAEEIRVLLARRRMSASELARRIGQSQPYLSRRLTGEVALDVDDLVKIAQVLDVSPGSLLTGQDTLRSPRRRQTGRSDARRPPSARPSNVDPGSRRPKILVRPR